MLRKNNGEAMNDEISAARRKKRRRYNLKRLARFLAVVLMLCIAITAANSVTSTTAKDIGDFFGGIFASSSGWPVELGESSVIQTEKLTGAFAVVTDGELIVTSRRGARLLELKHGMVSPFIAASGKRIALCNRGSRDITVCNRTSELAEIQTDGVIIDAAMSENGQLAVLCGSERYTCEMGVYSNGLYERRMNWKCASGFPLLVRISSRGSRAAAVTVSLSLGQLESTVTVINTKDCTEQSITTIEGLICELYVEDDGGFVAVTEEEICRCSAAGEQTARYSFAGKPLLNISRKGTRLAVAFGDNSRSAINSVVVLNRSLAEICTISGCGEIKDMCFSSDRLYLLGSGRLSVYNTAGKNIKVYIADTKAQSIVDFSSIIEILPDSAQLVTEQLEQQEQQKNDDAQQDDGQQNEPNSQEAAN